MALHLRNAWNLVELAGAVPPVSPDNANALSPWSNTVAGTNRSHLNALVFCVATRPSPDPDAVDAVFENPGIASDGSLVVAVYFARCFDDAPSTSTAQSGQSDRSKTGNWMSSNG